MKIQYSALSLFAGCGGSDLGLADAGVEVSWANEIDEAACDLYSEVTKNNSIECADIRDIDKFRKADILAGCYPCQGYSQAGRRKSHDNINFLYREFDRVLRATRPLAFIVENVDGMSFTQNEALLTNQLIRFRLAGYHVTWQVLNAKDYGLAQERRRLFIVGIRSSMRKHYVFPRASHGPQRRYAFRTLKDVIWHLRDAPLGSYDAEPFHWYYLSRNRRRTWGQQAPCIVAHWRHVPLHPDSPPLVKLGPDHWEFANQKPARRYSYYECAAVQGFPRQKAFDKNSVSVKRRFRAIGNAVPPPLFKAVARSLVQQLNDLQKSMRRR